MDTLVITVELDRDLAALLCGTLMRAADQYPDSPNQRVLFQKVEVAVDEAHAVGHKRYVEGLEDAAREAERFAALFADRSSPTKIAATEIVSLIRNLKKSSEEIAHEDSYWDDPLRGTNKC